MSKPVPPSDELPLDASDLGQQAEQRAANALIANSRRRLAEERGKYEALFEHHKHRPVIDLGLRLYIRDKESAGSVVGSAIAFRLFMFFVPMVLLIVGTLGFLSSYIETEHVDDAGITGNMASQINTALSQSHSTRWIAVGVGLVGVLSGGRTLSKALTQASCLAWRLPMSSKASMRVIGCVTGLVMSMGMMGIIVNWVRHRMGLGATGLSFLAALGFYMVAWWLVLALLPRQLSDPGVLLPGALLQSATLAGLQAVSQLYLPGKFDRASDLYGSIGAVIVGLGWFFIGGRALVSSMVLNAVLYERFGSITKLVFGLPILRILPRHSPWFRRQLRLDQPDVIETAADDLA